MYLPGNVWANTAEQAMCAELMKFMGMLLLGNAIRMEAVIKAVTKTVHTPVSVQILTTTHLLLVCP